MDKKLLLFGAGKIGRSFIGQLFSRSGYEVVFADINTGLIDRINQNREYTIIIRSGDGDEVLTIKNVRGIDLSRPELVAHELAGADIAALSVGQPGLPAAIPLIANGLIRRREQFGDWPLDIIIAENMRNSDAYLARELALRLPDDYPLNRLAGLVETSIGKMVPIMTQKDLEDDPLQVFAEPYNTLIVARKGFRNPVPDVMNLAPKDNIKAWVDRKLFIHNLGHATAAYLGFRQNPGATCLYEVLENPDVLQATRQTMLQSAEILMALYPGEFTPAQLGEHTDDLLHRFRNRALGDTVFRVGCDLYRKLGPEDRLVAPIKAAIALGKPYDLIRNALIAGISFRATDENGRFFPGDEKFIQEAEKGINHVLHNVCGLWRLSQMDQRY